MSRSRVTGPCWSNRTAYVSTTSTTSMSGCSGTSDRHGCVTRKPPLTLHPAQRDSMPSRYWPMLASRGAPPHTVYCESSTPAARSRSPVAAGGSGRHRRGKLLSPRARVPQSCGAGAWATSGHAADPFDLVGWRVLSRHRIRRKARGRTRRPPVSRLSIRTKQGLRARSRCRGRWPVNRPTHLPPGVRPILSDRRQDRSSVAAARDSRDWPRLRAGMRVQRPRPRGLTRA